MYRINPFVRIYERENVKALFNTVNLNTLYISREMYDKVIAEPTAQMIEEKFLVPPDFDTVEYFKENMPKSKDNDIRITYFLLTSVCNFKCKYCYVENRIEKHDNAFMTIEIAEKGIQLLKRNIKNDKKTTIIFYGGEPFLNFEVLKYVVERTKELGMKLEYKVITNGSIMNDEIANFIKENRIIVGVSIDGLESTNDEMRIDLNDEGTFKKINSTISTFSENGIIFGISCTISKHNMNKMDEILSIMEQYNIKGMGYNLPAENGKITFTDEEKQEIVKNLIKVEDTIFEKRIFEDRVINRRLKAFVEKKVLYKDCAGYGHQIGITPTGKVGVCHGLWPDEINQKENVYFDIDVNYTGLVNEHPIWIEWFNRTPFNMPQCWNCEAKGLCGGGCAQKPFLRTGSIWDVDTDICILMKEAVPWTIWKYFDVKVKSEFEKLKTV